MSQHDSHLKLASATVGKKPVQRAAFRFMKYVFVAMVLYAFTYKAIGLYNLLKEGYSGICVEDLHESVLDLLCPSTSNQRQPLSEVSLNLNGISRSFVDYGDLKKILHSKALSSSDMRTRTGSMRMVAGSLSARSKTAVCTLRIEYYPLKKGLFRLTDAYTNCPFFYYDPEGDILNFLEMGQLPPKLK